MDWFIIKIPTTKEAVRRKYGIDVSGEGEQEPEVRGAGGEDTADDALTQYVGFEVNDKGGVNRYSWVNDIELEDLENYQARAAAGMRQVRTGRPLPDRSCSTAWRTPGEPAAGSGGGLYWGCDPQEVADGNWPAG